ncbi:hypothetical protein CEP82_005525 [Mobiluncus mulieris]|nr:hypothetical protein HMPREF0577_1393 [Mobiluncus mulieris ATCC 35243]NMW75604.1 hypothetical protein [Mobiluncus mulieris]PNL43289.1 hypothetical protein CEP82_005525 [Mobiluncus mulieris]
MAEIWENLRVRLKYMKPHPHFFTNFCHFQKNKDLGWHLMKTRKTYGHLASRKKNPARQKHRSRALPVDAFTLGEH